MHGESEGERGREGERREGETLLRIMNIARVCGIFVQGVESVFDVMDMEDDQRNDLLKFSDAQMQVYTQHVQSLHLSMYLLPACRMWPGSATAIPTLTSPTRSKTRTALSRECCVYNLSDPSDLFSIVLQWGAGGSGCEAGEGGRGGGVASRHRSILPPGI